MGENVELGRGEGEIGEEEEEVESGHERGGEEKRGK